MRLIKLLSIALLAVAAVLGGFVVAAVIAGATVVAWLVRRFIFKVAPAGSVTTSAGPVRPRATDGDGGVIDVTATEVPATTRDS